MFNGYKYTSLQNITFVFLTLVLSIISLKAEDILPERYFRDYRKTLEISSGSFEGEYGRSFETLAALLSSVPEPAHRALTLIFGIVALYFVTRLLRSPLELIVGSFLLSPALVFSFSLPNKDTILIAVTMYLVFLSRKLDKYTVFLLILISLYLIYAFLFRSYYLLIILTFLTAQYYLRSGSIARMATIAVLFLIYFSIPVELLQYITDLRDQGNHYRVLNLASGARTVFFNLYSPVDHFTFILNYAYAFVRLNFPVLFVPGIAEGVMTLVTVLYLGTVALPLIKFPARHKASIFSCMILSHILILTLFEPDLGSYLRHLTACFVFAAAALMYSDTWVGFRSRLLVQSKIRPS